jgi:molybdenum cofactor cytidylyltransferase
MVATVKIIPFAVPESVVETAVRTIADAGRPILAVAPYRQKSVTLIATTLPGLKASVMDKTRRILEDRLQPTGAILAGEERVVHDEAAVAAAIKTAAKDSDIVLIFGASAITDHDDVIPTAIERAGGTVRHFGMPVDPGNLLLLGDLDGKPVIGAPGCARSPKENGFDWVLSRLLADLPVSAETLTSRGRDRASWPGAGRGRSPQSSWRPGNHGAWAPPTSCWRDLAASRWCGGSFRRRSLPMPIRSLS